MTSRTARLSVREFVRSVAAGEILPGTIAPMLLAARERNPGPVYTSIRRERIEEQTGEMAKDGRGGGALRGLPVSVKDLMDVAGERTGCGSRQVMRSAMPERCDAAFVEKWRDAGALLVGKTHLNEHAYGITGENPWLGDCTIPGDPGALTGGSSSGAAASVLEGSAWIGLGTDTGGSLRVPASLCGLVSLRAPGWFPDHRGTRPLAPGFDTLGWIQRGLGDVEFVARALLGGAVDGARDDAMPTRLGWMTGRLLEGCDPAVLGAFDSLRGRLTEAGLEVDAVASDGFENAVDVFAMLQAREAFGVHQVELARDPDCYSAPVRARLEWGGALRAEELGQAAAERTRIVSHLDGLLEGGRVLLLPAAPMTRLVAGVDHSRTRREILKLTTPASLGVYPVLTVPDESLGGRVRVGYQFIAERGGEWRLVELAERLARWATC
jgi:Asp-tRNA(Asn)/Glu-tRNA(Gln) amidotransferase A subunit family amidase